MLRAMSGKLESNADGWRCTFSVKREGGSWGTIRIQGDTMESAIASAYWEWTWMSTNEWKAYAI